MDGSHETAAVVVDVGAVEIPTPRIAPVLAPAPLSRRKKSSKLSKLLSPQAPLKLFGAVKNLVHGRETRVNES